MRIGKSHPIREENRSHRLPPAAAALLLIAALGLGLGGCESKPEAPTFDNVFDPDGPYAGDPLRISCDFADSTITVKWFQPQGYGIAYYSVSHSNSPGSGFEFLEDVAATASETGIYFYKPAAATMPHFFRVVAYNEDDEYLTTSLQTPGDGTTGPIVETGIGTSTTPTRWLELAVGVTQGTSVRIANRADFGDAQEFEFNEDLDPLEIPWDLGPATENGDTLRLYVRAYGADFVSAMTRKTLTAKFDPKPVLDGGGTTCASRQPLLAASTAGAVQVRLGATAEDVELAEWSDYAPENLTWEFEDTLGEQSVFGQFRGDFGFDSAVHELVVTGDPLTDVDVDVDLDGATGYPTVDLLCDAVATEVRIGEQESFATATWQAYADTVEYTLSAGSGHKIVYVQYRNDFTDSPILSVAVDYVAQPFAVGFTAPLPSQRLIGGTPLQVSGWAGALEGEAPVDSVKVHFADGNGWIKPTGVREWTATWDVPEVASSVELTMRARAFAGADTANALIEVVIDPPPPAR